jgi:outer membrane protein assembly factor BamD (BamD/ComL family)
MKKLIFLALVVGGTWWYATHKFNFNDTLDYAKKNKEKPWSSAIAYSVGMVYYQRDDYPKAQEVFTGLLTDYPTGQYTPRAMLRLSEVADRNRDFQTEKDILDRFTTEYPDHPDRLIATKRRELLYNK